MLTSIDGAKPSLMVKEAKYFLNRMKKKDIKPSAWTFNSFMTFYMLKEDYLKVEKYFNAMKQEGVAPNLKSYSIMLTTYFKSRNVLKAQEILDQLDREKLVFDKVLYTICLDGFQKYGMYEKALSYYVKMLGRGYRPGIEDYHVLFDIYCRKGDIGTASRFWSEFIEAGHSPNEITFCLFIKAYGICGDLENAKLAFGIMDRFGIEKTVISYNTLISTHLKQGKISEALGIVDEMIELGIKPDLRTSYMVLNGYAKIGDEANLLKAFGRHVESGFQADAFAINTIVAFYTKKNETDKAMKIAQFLFDSSKDNPRLNIEPAYTHSIVMQPMVSNHMYPQMEKYYAFLKEIKLFNTVCFDIYLRSIYSRGNYDLIAKEFWANIVTNITPDHRLYDTFISIMLKGGRKIECRYAIKHMLKNGLRPTRRITRLMDQVGELEYLNFHDQRTIEPLE
jgi:pentatricopeptide repeat protein